jgi:hypothetical protein
MSATAKNNGPTVLNPDEPVVSLGPVKLVKIQQTESGPFTTSNNLCSIEFDGENVTDLKRSYLDLHVRFSDGAEPGTDVQLGDMATDSRYMGSSFFKTVTLKSENVGMVEQMRYQNVHSESMKQFVKYTQEEDSANVLNNGGSVKVDANGEAHIIVHLKDILPGCGNAALPYPNNRMGPSILELELEDVKSVAYSSTNGSEVTYLLSCDEIAAIDEDREITQLTLTQPFDNLTTAQLYFLGADKSAAMNWVSAGDINLDASIIITAVAYNAANSKVTLTFTLDDGTNLAVDADESLNNIQINSFGPVELNSKAGDDVTGSATATTDVSVLTFTAEVGDFIIGQDLFVAWFQRTSAGLAPTDEYKYAQSVIADVKVNTTTPTKVDITFEDTIFTLPAGFNATQIYSFADIEPVQLTWSISEVDLILVKPVKPFEVPVYEIKPMNLEMVNLPGGQPFFRRQFELEQSCDLVQLLNPTTTLISVKQFNAYRNALNSVQTTTQDVEVDLTNNGSLYFDRWLTAMDEVKRLQFRNGELEVAAIAEAVNPQVVGLPNNVLEFQLMDPVAGGNAASMLYCYKRITRMF